MSPTHRDKSAAGRRGRRKKLQGKELERVLESLLHIRAAVSSNQKGEVAPRCGSSCPSSLFPLRGGGLGAGGGGGGCHLPPACISFLKWGSSQGAEKGGRMVLS